MLFAVLTLLGNPLPFILFCYLDWPWNWLRWPNPATPIGAAPALPLLTPPSRIPWEETSPPFGALLLFDWAFGMVVPPILWDFWFAAVLLACLFLLKLLLLWMCIERDCYEGNAFAPNPLTWLFLLFDCGCYTNWAAEAPFIWGLGPPLGYVFPCSLLVWAFCCWPYWWVRSLCWICWWVAIDWEGWVCSLPFWGDLLTEACWLFYWAPFA